MQAALCEVELECNQLCEEIHKMQIRVKDLECEVVGSRNKGNWSEKKAWIPCFKHYHQTLNDMKEQHKKDS